MMSLAPSSPLGFPGQFHYVITEGNHHDDATAAHCSTAPSPGTAATTRSRAYVLTKINEMVIQKAMPSLAGVDEAK